jgi:putative aminopeptidase FrvX
MLDLLAELVACPAPPGEEGAIDDVIIREMATTGAVTRDAADNLHVRLPGAGPTVMVCAHKDEIGMLVTDVRPDGRLCVENIGGSYPWKYGEGPVDVIADNGTLVRGILSVGSTHAVSGPVHELKTQRALTWRDVTIFTGMEPEELAQLGVHVGSRAVVTSERKALQRLGDYIASYALDDRMGVVALSAGMRAMADVAEADRPDLHFVVTHGEEIGMLGAVYAAQQIRPDVCIALDTSPVAHGTPVKLDARPVVWYRELTHNTKSECDRLCQLGEEIGVGAQPCAYAAAASDAGRVRQQGLAGHAVCFGFARDNSHGFEIAHAASMAAVTELLVAYLLDLRTRG